MDLDSPNVIMILIYLAMVAMLQVRSRVVRESIRSGHRIQTPLLPLDVDDEILSTDFQFNIPFHACSVFDVSSRAKTVLPASIRQQGHERKNGPSVSFRDCLVHGVPEHMAHGTVQRN